MDSRRGKKRYWSDEAAEFLPLMGADESLAQQSAAMPNLLENYAEDWEANFSQSGSDDDDYVDVAAMIGNLSVQSAVAPAEMKREVKIDRDIVPVGSSTQVVPPEALVRGILNDMVEKVIELGQKPKLEPKFDVEFKSQWSMVPGGVSISSVSPESKLELRLDIQQQVTLNDAPVLFDAGAVEAEEVQSLSTLHPTIQYMLRERHRPRPISVSPEFHHSVTTPSPSSVSPDSGLFFRHGNQPFCGMQRFFRSCFGASPSSARYVNNNRSDRASDDEVIDMLRLVHGSHR